jgi:hypothetical protein
VIKMFDGIVRTLIEVLHVPTMSRNLISLSTLDVKGYKYCNGDGVMKVTKGSLMVMKGGFEVVLFLQMLLLLLILKLLKFIICVLGI